MNTKPDSPDSRPRRRWLQFGVRGVLLATLVAAGVAWWMSRPEDLHETGPDGAYQLFRQVRRDREGQPVNHGRWVLRDDEGRLLCEGEYHNGKTTGWWTYYYPGGGKRLEGACHDGRRHGRWIAWHHSGEKQRESDYREGQPHGPIKRWDENGGLLPDREIAADSDGLDKWRQAFDGDDHGRRLEAAWALGRWPTVEADGVVRSAIRSPDPHKRRLALLAAAHRPLTSGFTGDLTAALDDEDRLVRLAAIDALSRYPAETGLAVDRLQQRLPCDEVLERCYIQRAIAMLDPHRSEAIEPLVGLYVHVRLEEVEQPENLRRVSHDGDPLPPLKDAAAALVSALRSDGSRTRAFAAAGLAALATPPQSALDPLIRCLDDADYAVRRYSCLALGQLGPDAKAAVPRLERLRKSDAKLRPAADAALKRIEPPNLGNNFF